MLEFIVLGEVPGTQFQITFVWLMQMGSILLEIGLVIWLIHPRHIHKTAAWAHIVITRLPQMVKHFVHRVAALPANIVLR